MGSAGLRAAVDIMPAEKGNFGATPLDPDHPWMPWAARSIERTTGETPVVCPTSAALCPMMRQGLAVMTSLYWDFGEADLPWANQKSLQRPLTSQSP